LIKLMALVEAKSLNSSTLKVLNKELLFYQNPPRNVSWPIGMDNPAYARERARHDFYTDEKFEEMSHSENINYAYERLIRINASLMVARVQKSKDKHRKAFDALMSAMQTYFKVYNIPKKAQQKLDMENVQRGTNEMIQAGKDDTKAHMQTMGRWK